MANCMRRRCSIPSMASVGRSGRALYMAQATARTVAPIGINHHSSADTPLAYALPHRPQCAHILPAERGPAGLAVLIRLPLANEYPFSLGPRRLKLRFHGGRKSMQAGHSWGYPC